MNILADIRIPYLKGVAEQFGEVEYLPGNEFTKESIKDKDALIVRTVTHFGEKNLPGSNVKLICSATIGFDHIDTEYCDKNGVAWRTAPGCNANSVEQYVTASLLHLADKYKFDLKDKTIGIVGVGNVGSKVEIACGKLGMRVLLNDPPRMEKEGSSIFVDIETIKKECDFITVHTPLTKFGAHKTHHLVNDSFLDGVAKKPFIINAARGGVTNNESLKKAIKSEKISGAVIDCWENEPNIDRELLALVDIASPHIAGYSADGKWTATRMSIENLKSFFKIDIEPKYRSLPEPLNPVIDLQNVPQDNQLDYAVWHSYNPVKESELLKLNPEKFYWFRSNYPLRREYGAYTVKNFASEVSELLNQLGFNLDLGFNLNPTI